MADRIWVNAVLAYSPEILIVMVTQELIGGINTTLSLSFDSDLLNDGYKIKRRSSKGTRFAYMHICMLYTNNKRSSHCQPSRPGFEFFGVTGLHNGCAVASIARSLKYYVSHQLLHSYMHDLPCILYLVSGIKVRLQIVTSILFIIF